MLERETFLARLVQRIRALDRGGIVRVAIGGVDAAGKTRLADDLAREIERTGLPAIRVSLDGFHHPRAFRYRRGRHSPEGYYRDSFDLAVFKACVLEPLGPAGTGRYRQSVFDHRSDRPTEAEEKTAPLPAALIVDGVFLQRPELADQWDLTIFLDVPFEIAFARAVRRGDTPADPDDPANRRYRDGQRLFLAECDPQGQADILVDYADFDRPRILRDRAKARPKSPSRT